MSNNKWPLQKDAVKFYGNPTGKDGNASMLWEVANLTYIKPPFKMWMGHIPITRIKIHKKCADSLLKVLNNVWEKCGKDQAVVDKLKYSEFSGTYVYRNKRNGATLSMHSFGCAIDIDAIDNGLGDQTPLFLDGSIIVKAFKEEGWTCGVDWVGKGKDAMHFQAANVR